MILHAVLALLIVLAVQPLALAQDDDVISRALVDELDRSMKRLKIEGHAPPYFVSYQVNDSDRFEVEATFGAIIKSKRDRWRDMEPTVRCGDYNFDSSNFVSDRSVARSGTNSAPVDNDYNALRRKAWLLTDVDYKNAVETLEEKKAFFKRNNVKDKLDDFSHEVPEQSIAEIKQLHVDEKLWNERARKLSAVFREYPDIQQSKVTVQAFLVNRWFVNSEGARIRDTKEEWNVVVAAATQAPDGERLKDYDCIGVRTESELPSFEKMEELARDLADRLTKLAKAPVVEDYDGPVLFEGQAAAEFFEQLLADNLTSEHQAISNQLSTSSVDAPLATKVGKRVLPRFLSVVDDPFATEFKGVPLIGGYTFDNEGVRARRVMAIAKGVLKALCTDRTPTKFSNHSNGHSNGYSGSTSILYVLSDSLLSNEEMRNRMKELAKESEVPYVLVARRLVDPNALTMLNLPDSNSSLTGLSLGVSLPNPALLYRLWLDSGKEELVRGARFAPTTIRVLREIEAAGGQLEPYLVGRGPDNYTHLICPSILIKGLEIESDKSQTEKTPLLPNPLSR